LKKIPMDGSFNIPGQACVPEVDPKGWTKFGRRLDGAAG
jgi:hypothetical protein